MINTNYSMPSFKGLIYFKDYKKVVNTDSIRSMAETYQDKTDIFFKSVPESGTYAGKVSVKSDIESVLAAYKASRGKDSIIVVRHKSEE